MSFVLRHSLTKAALQDLLDIFNEHFPGLVPATTYLFHKSYGEYGQYETHFYCSTCENYIGNTTANSICSVCSAPFNADNNLKSGSYFLVLDLAAQIKAILENPDITVTSTPVSSSVSDISSGAQYQKLMQTGALQGDDISLLWNSDGIPAFESNTFQIWPIQCQIIELNPKDRRTNICVPCLWFGHSKPNMLSFLTAFVDQLKTLEDHGITWRDHNNVEHITKVHALVCSADSVARPMLRNSKQFNGNYGCDFCVHVGGGNYSSSTPEPQLRTDADHFRHAMAGTADQPVMGVKGPSPLMKLGNFQMVTGFVPDYLHSVCLGTTRQLAKLWFDSTNHTEEWYLGPKEQQAISKTLLSIKPPVEVTRTPRSLDDRKYWKASEWRSFLLFYALPILSGVLKKRYWNHLFLLVFSVYTLLQEKIKACDIDLAERALKKFTGDFERLYGTCHMTFNVHLMTHLAESVRSWGPLWATSTFPFESYNGTLLTFFNGTSHVPIQVANRFLRWKSLNGKANIFLKTADPTVRELFWRLQNSHSSTTNSSRLQEHVRVFGKATGVQVNVLQKLAIRNLLGVTVESCLLYHRFIINGTLFHSSDSKLLQKKNNSIVELDDGTLCKIVAMAVIESENQQMSCVLVKGLEKAPNPLHRDSSLNISSSRWIHEVSQSNNTFAVRAESIKSKCVMLETREKLFVISSPNKFERD